MDLSEARVPKERTTPVRTPYSRYIRAFGIGGQIKYVPVSAGPQDHCIREMNGDLTFTCAGASEQQICEVRTCDEQDETGNCKQHPEWGFVFLAQIREAGSARDRALWS